MSLIEREFHEFDSERSWMEVYQRLRNEASLLTMDQDRYNVTEARKPENRGKNRYRDVSPYDHSRILLKQGDSDYINANLIEVEEANRKYILTQGPLENTSGQFWQMIWEQDSRAIVMLNRVMEKGSLKCHQYWPLGSAEGYEDDMVFNEVGIQISLQGENNCGNFITRWIEVTNLETDEKRQVMHYQYTTWPDFGVPSSPDAFLNFLTTVRETGAMDPNVGPAVVHCSAGIGRSGTFCLVDSCLVLVEKHQSMEGVDIKAMLIKMRTYRMGLIQTPDQLRFSYLAVIAGSRRILGSNGDVVPETSEDSPPPPPIRTTSLSPAHLDGAAPPIPPKLGDARRRMLSFSDDDDDEDDDGEDEILYRADQEDYDNFQESDGEDSADYSDKDVSWTEGDMEGSKEEESLLEKTEDASTNDGAPLESGYEVRRRVREERKKQTKEQIRAMKDRQRKSEVWRKRHSILRPVGFGLLLLLGGFLVWRFYWRSSADPVPI